MLIRDAEIRDFPRLLELNEASVEFLSPLTPARLAHLHAQAAYHRLVESDGIVVAFLLVFRQGADYDSPNYRWFVAHYAEFLYVDRVVVALDQQGRGLGPQLYADLFEFARRSGAECITCEFDIDPPNEPSRRFHARHGFAEIGTQQLPSGKRVSLQAVALR